MIANYLNSTSNGIPYGAVIVTILLSSFISNILGLAAKNEAIPQSRILLLATRFSGGFKMFPTFAIHNHIF